MASKLLSAISCLVVLSTALGTYSAGQVPATSETAKDSVSLQVGDQAPKLQVDDWLGGAPVESYSKESVYVVEFWATWCGPCVKSMPHLSELADRYVKEGLVVVAATKTDDANTREAVEKFVQGPGKEYRFRYAVCESDATYRDYMEAAGQNGIPCSFVIDREGKIAYIGLPHDLDYVLERVIKGQWRGKTDADELREMNASVGKLGELAQTDPDKALQIVDHVRRVNPNRAKSLDFAYAESLVLCKKKLFDRAKENIESLSDSSNKFVDWGGVAMISGLLASPELNAEGTHRDYALAKIKAAESALKNDWQNLMQVGLAYQFSGQKEKYKECMDKVIALCPDEQIKTSLKTAVDMQLQAPGK